MTIKVKFFASLRDQLNMAEIEVDQAQANNALEVWQQASNWQDIPENLLVSINLEHASLQSPVADGDEVAFFPPVTGG